jgi:hypothetical protein
VCFLDRHGHCPFLWAVGKLDRADGKGNGQKFMNKAAKIVPPPISAAKSDRPALQGRIVHGYDSDDLFREDLWLRRIEQSRKQLVAPEASMQLMTRSVNVGEEDLKRICAMLAQSAGTKFDN